MDKHRLINLSHVNACSIANKIDQFQVEVCDNKMDICSITETWIKKDDIEAITKEVPPLGYKIFSKPRTTGKNGGGLALVYKDYLTVHELIAENHTFNTIEIQGYHVRLDHISINLYVTYRIPSTSIISFCDELLQVLEEDIVKPANKTLLVGDFNIHVDDSSDSDTITFMDLLDSYNMLNKVTFPTHVKHHSLDLVIEDRDNTVATNVKEGLFLSDHCFVHSTLDIITPKPKECVLTFRKLKSIDHSTLKSDIEESLSKIGLRNSIDVQHLVGSYNTVLSELWRNMHHYGLRKSNNHTDNHGLMIESGGKSYSEGRKKEHTEMIPQNTTLTPSINSADLYPKLSKLPKEHITLNNWQTTKPTLSGFLKFPTNLSTRTNPYR